MKKPFNFKAVVAIHGRMDTKELSHKYDGMRLMFLNPPDQRHKNIARTVGNLCQYILRSRGINRPKLNKELELENN